MEFHDRPDGATAGDIASWEKAFKMLMPEDLKQLLTLSNGPVLFDAATDKELQFWSVEEAIDAPDVYGLEDECPDAVPIAMDGSGNLVVYRKVSRRPAAVYAMASGNLGWEEAVRVCNDVDGLIALPDPIAMP